MRMVALAAVVVLFMSAFAFGDDANTTEPTKLPPAPQAAATVSPATDIGAKLPPVTKNPTAKAVTVDTEMSAEEDATSNHPVLKYLTREFVMIPRFGLQKANVSAEARRLERAEARLKTEKNALADKAEKVEAAKDDGDSKLTRAEGRTQLRQTIKTQKNDLHMRELELQKSEHADKVDSVEATRRKLNSF